MLIEKEMHKKLDFIPLKCIFDNLNLIHQQCIDKLNKVNKSIIYELKTKNCNCTIGKCMLRSTVYYQTIVTISMK